MRVKGRSKNVLVAPLDWGLGHTTRCIPIIRTLLSAGHQVWIAGNGVQQDLTAAACPGVRLLHLDGYGIRYSRNALMATLAGQIPRILTAVRQEHRWLEATVAAYGIDGVISDNRYGLYHHRVSSVILTHQLRPISGLGRLADNMLQRQITAMLSRFNACWVVDRADRGLAGRLSIAKKVPAHATYIGWLSQCDAAAPPAKAHKAILILLSGPEPQRSILSKKLWAWAVSSQHSVVFVEGKAGTHRASPPHIRHLDIADAALVARLIADAGLVICRSGYSTLMDLEALGKRAVLIPTPGQTEQEYLATHLCKLGRHACVDQSLNGLDEQVERAWQLSPPATDPEAFRAFEEPLRAWVEGL